LSTAPIERFFEARPGTILEERGHSIVGGAKPSTSGIRTDAT
jgi:hypothetical protein